MSVPGRPVPIALWGHQPREEAQGQAGAYADVAVDVGAAAEEPLFTYAVPAALAARVRPGHRVLVPLANRQRPVQGVVFALREQTDVPRERLRALASLVDEEPALSAHELELARHIAEQTCCGLGQALRPLLPPGAAAGVRVRTVPAYFALGEAGAAERVLARAPQQLRAWRLVRAEPGLTQADLTARGCPAAGTAALVRRGLVERRAVALRRDPFAGEVAPAREPEVPPPLTDEQAAAVEAIASGIDGPARWVLHGVTGSGKTEVYLRAIERVLALGRQALVLVPEIALTPQTVSRFRARFGPAVAVLHSGLGAGERHDEWWRIRRGEVSVAVGARSAVFAPFPRLGLIVVDEEHEGSYRQDEAPRYHARDVALWRGERLSIPVVLGSATPDLGTYASTARGDARRLDLTRRALDRPLPVVHLVDRRRPPGTGAAAGLEGGAAGVRAAPSLLTPALCEAVSRHLEARGQVLLFLNRRGFAPLLLCGACGFSARCQSCSVSLCYHEADRALHCHYCGARRPVPRTCPGCGGAFLWLRGSGTERVAAEVARLWPRARVLRMDMDTTAAKGAHRRIYEAFRAGEADVLVGTQMVAKGWDVAGVTLVGVVDADTALHHPDYRSAERTFQLLCQVAGRAGRGAEPGEVVVQTYCPDHPAIAAAASHDYRAFAAGELAVRRQAGFPPFAHLVRLLSWAPGAADAESGARALEHALRAAGIPPGVDLWGPGAAPLARLRGQYRWHMALRGPEAAVLRGLARAALRQALRRRPAARLAIDPDPLSMV